MSVELDNLKAQVKANTDVTASAVLLINGFAARLQAVIDAGGKPEEFQALADEIKGSSQSLADAVVANTPVNPQHR